MPAFLVFGALGLALAWAMQGKAKAKEVKLDPTSQYSVKLKSGQQVIMNAAQLQQAIAAKGVKTFQKLSSKLS